MLTRNPSGISLTEREVGQWHVETFGPTCRERIEGLADKLTEEHGELQDELRIGVGAEGLAEECADVFIVLLAIAYRCGFDLEHEARKKFEKVRNRDQKARDEAKARRVTP